MDEQAHLDLVLKYSAGHVPHSIEKLSTETASYIPRYESPEFFNIPANQPGGVFQDPPWTKAEGSMQRYYAEGTIFWSTNYNNHESSQAPIYYVIAGTWTNIGESLGITGGYLLYWIRFLNIIFIITLVIISWKIGLELFPEDRFLNLGIPMLVGIMPQDSYYAIENDVLSPVFFGIALFFLIKYIKSGGVSKKLSIITGLALAGTILVKIANLPLVVIALVATIIIALKKKQIKMPICLFLACTIIPVSIWMSWNYLTYGDLTASEEKIKILGWTHKSMSEWRTHPIFSLAGFWEFLLGILSTFWRGELIWWTKPIANKITDYFYITSTIVFLGISATYNKNKNTSIVTQTNRIALLGFLSLIGFMIILSLSFDFGNCENPSRAHPYFVSGRLISGALIPFAILYLQGLQTILKKVNNEHVKLYIFIALIIAITISEYFDNIDVFSSRFNFFQL
jgi:hypothetical protein